MPLKAIVLAFVVLAGTSAWLFRYEPMPFNGSQNGVGMVWDRWTHRNCFVVMAGSPSSEARLICSAGG